MGVGTTAPLALPCVPEYSRLLFGVALDREQIYYLININILL